MMSYNSYRKRNYHLSHNQARKYAQAMDALSSYFNNKSDWTISTHLDSCYCDYPKYTIRLSNHSADNQYHDLNGTNGLLVNIRCRKLDFIDTIENKIPEIVKQLDKLPLQKYRFINIVNNKINCFYRNFKTKKDEFLIK